MNGAAAEVAQISKNRRFCRGMLTRRGPQHGSGQKPPVDQGPPGRERWCLRNVVRIPRQLATVVARPPYLCPHKLENGGLLLHRLSKQQGFVDRASTITESGQIFIKLCVAMASLALGERCE